MLSEAEVQRSFARIFKDSDTIDEKVLTQAEELLDELRPESPLRHRLSQEIDELRDKHVNA